MTSHCLFFFKTVNQIKWRQTTKENISVGCVPPACQTVRVLVTITRCQWWGGSLGEQVWIGLQWWPPDVTNACQCLPGEGVSAQGCLPSACCYTYPLGRHSPPWTDRLTDKCKNITCRHFVCGRQQHRNFIACCCCLWHKMAFHSRLVWMIISCPSTSRPISISDVKTCYYRPQTKFGTR